MHIKKWCYLYYNILNIHRSECVLINTIVHRDMFTINLGHHQPIHWQTMNNRESQRLTRRDQPICFWHFLQPNPSSANLRLCPSPDTRIGIRFGVWAASRVRSEQPRAMFGFVFWSHVREAPMIYSGPEEETNRRPVEFSYRPVIARQIRGRKGEEDRERVCMMGYQEKREKICNHNVNSHQQQCCHVPVFRVLYTNSNHKLYRHLKKVVLNSKFL